MNIHINQPGTEVHMCNPSMFEVEAVDNEYSAVFVHIESLRTTFITQTLYQQSKKK